MSNNDDRELQLPAQQMKQLGYRVIDMLVDHYSTVAAKPVKQEVDRSTLEARLLEPAPEEGTEVLLLLDQLRDDVFIDIEHKIHPRDFAFIPGPSNFVSVMADTIASGHNIFSGAQITSTGATIIEKMVCGWLCEMFGFSPAAGGLFVSGGSAANLTGLAVARNDRLGDTIGRVRVYFSDQTHVSNIKALKLLGFQAGHMCKLAADENFRLAARTLRRQIDEDRKAGIRPFCIIANAGTTNTGAVDPLDELATIRDAEDMWLHVDGAYGAAAALTTGGASLLNGIHRADSLAFDPHKWFFQPYEIGGIIVRDMALLQRTFATSAEYLRDIQHSEQPDLNYFDYGIQMTRSFRALKMWLSIKTFGMRAFRAAVERGIELAEVAERELKKSPNWEIVTPAQLGIINFRYRVAAVGEDILSEINQKIVTAMLADGFAFVLSTSLRGLTVLRICAINPRTSDDDIRQTLEKLQVFGDEAWRELQ